MQYLILRYTIVAAGDGMRKEILKYETIRNLRIDHNLTQQQISDMLHISQNTYSQYEIGKLNYPIDTLVALAPLSKIVLTLDMLFGRLELYPMLVLLYPGTWKRK